MTVSLCFEHDVLFGQLKMAWAFLAIQTANFAVRPCPYFKQLVTYYFPFVGKFVNTETTKPRPPFEYFEVINYL